MIDSQVQLKHLMQQAREQSPSTLPLVKAINFTNVSVDEIWRTKSFNYEWLQVYLKDHLSTSFHMYGHSNYSSMKKLDEVP